MAMLESKSTLYNKIHDDLKESMKNKDPARSSVLKMIISEIKNKTINDGKEITDDICKQVVKKSIKQHEDSIKQFTDANRTELVAKEALELTYLKFYVPNMMSEEETKSEINNIIKVNNIPLAKQNMGQIMKIVKSYDNIDMKIASKYINSILSWLENRNVLL